MNFKEKIDTLLKINTLGISSVFAMEKYIGTGTGTINGPYQSGSAPGLATQKKIYNTFGLTMEQWEAGDFSTLLQQGGKADKIDEGSERETIKALRDLVETKNQLILMLQKEVKRLEAELKN